MFEYKEIVNEFVDESDEVLESVVADVMDLEKSVDDETVNRVFRAFHSVKGNARMLGFDRLGELAHKAENLLSLVRSRAVGVHGATADLLLHTVDTMRLILKDISDGGGDGRATGTAMRLLDDAAASSGRPGEGGECAKPEQETARGGFALDFGEKPACNPPQVGAPPPAPSGGQVGDAGGTNRETAAERRLKILIVEDDFISRTVLDAFLSGHGDCDMAKDGLEAVFAFAESCRSDPPRPYDLVCMDIVMPAMDGIQASKKIREIERARGVEGTALETSIVITSEVRDPATVIRACYECGANYYFLKPLDFGQMERQMRKLGLIAPPGVGSKAE